MHIYSHSSPNMAQWLTLSGLNYIPISRTTFHAPKDVRAIEVRLYMYETTVAGKSLNKNMSEDIQEMSQSRLTALSKHEKESFCAVSAFFITKIYLYNLTPLNPIFI